MIKVKNILKGLSVVAFALCGVVGLSEGESKFVLNAQSTPTCAYEECLGQVTNGFCSLDSEHYQSAALTIGKYDFDKNPQTNDSVYEISNAGQLYWFMEHVNAGNTSSNAILTSDISINTGYKFSLDGANVVVKDRMNAVVSDLSVIRPWFPIGYQYDIDDDGKVEEVAYSGIFDGNSYTISELYLNNLKHGAGGIFGVARDSVVKNISIENSFIKSFTAGGIIGESKNSIIDNCKNRALVVASTVGGIVSFGGELEILNCVNDGEIVNLATGFNGGIIGWFSSEGKIENCINFSNLKGNVAGGIAGALSYSTVNSSYTEVVNCINFGDISSNYATGGIVGDCYSIVINCVNLGNITSLEGGNDVGGIVGQSHDVGFVANNYFIQDEDVNTGLLAIGRVEKDDIIDKCQAKTGAQFESGEVAYLLSQGYTFKQDGESDKVFSGSVWGQKIGVDDYPVFSDDEVYYGYVSCSDESMIYTNNANISLVRLKHTHIATAEGNKISAECSECEADLGEMILFAPTGNLIYNGAEHRASYFGSIIDYEPEIVYSTQDLAGAGEKVAKLVVGDVFASVSYTITPKLVTITAHNKTVEQYKTVPQFTYGVEGFIGQDTLVGEPTISVTASNTQTVGSFSIIVSNATASSNYQFSYVNGVLNITPHINHVKGSDATCESKAVCSVCNNGYGEPLGHKYDNDCDTTCNECSAERVVGEHVDNDKNNLCDNCGFELVNTTLIIIIVAGGVVLCSTVITICLVIRKKKIKKQRMEKGLY